VSYEVEGKKWLTWVLKVNDPVLNALSCKQSA